MFVPRQCCRYVERTSRALIRHNAPLLGAGTGTIRALFPQNTRDLVTRQLTQLRYPEAVPRHADDHIAVGLAGAAGHLRHGVCWTELAPRRGRRRGADPRDRKSPKPERANSAPRSSRRSRGAFLTGMSSFRWLQRLTPVPIVVHAMLFPKRWTHCRRRDAATWALGQTSDREGSLAVLKARGPV